MVSSMYIHPNHCATQVETVCGHGGMRQVTLWVPYWVRNYSGLPLQFMHDPKVHAYINHFIT